MKHSLILLIVICTILCVGCSTKQIGPQTMNNSLAFLLTKNNQRLPDSIVNNIKMAYYEGNNKKYINDLSRGINEGGFMAYDIGLLSTRDIGGYSSGGGIKNYYLEYPNGQIDTLYVDYRVLSYDQALKDPCFCYYPLVEVRYNGQPANLDSSITMQKVYSFKK